MSMLTLPARWDAAINADVATGPNAVLQRVVAKLARLRRQHRLTVQLDSLSDRELDDIGISRADIPTIARRER